MLTDLNRSFYKHEKTASPEFGKKVYGYTEPLEYCREEGISVFAINYGTGASRRDRLLQKIARETGGAVFDARDRGELEGVYSTIVNQVLHEYYLAYRATMVPADRRWLKVNFSRYGRGLETARYYFTSTVFGIPLNRLHPLLILPLLLALVLAWLLSKMKFEKEAGDPYLSVLNRGPADAVTRTLALNSSRTVIGGGPGSDMTISGGLTRVKEKHATVLYDQKRRKYTLVSDGDVKVNNKRVRNRDLESGDIINVEGTTIVFDDGRVD